MDAHGQSARPGQEQNEPTAGAARREAARARRPGDRRRESGGGRRGVPGEQAWGLEGRGREQASQDLRAAPGWGRGRVGARRVPDAGPFSRYLLEVPVDRMQVVLEVRNEGLLAALQRLLVPHAILQAVEHPAHAGAQRLDGTDGLSEGLQVHSDTEQVRHVAAATAGSPESASLTKGRAR